MTLNLSITPEALEALMGALRLTQEEWDAFDNAHGNTSNVGSILIRAQYILKARKLLDLPVNPRDSVINPRPMYRQSPDGLERVQ